MQFLLEAILLAALGGAVGVLAGSGVARLVEWFAEIPVVVRPGLVVAALTLATLVGLASGFFPSMRASRLQPVDALRAE